MQICDKELIMLNNSYQFKESQVQDWQKKLKRAQNIFKKKNNLEQVEDPIDFSSYIDPNNENMNKENHHNLNFQLEIEKEEQINRTLLSILQ